jgi:hypothetical protein
VENDELKWWHRVCNLKSRHSWRGAYGRMEKIGDCRTTHIGGNVSSSSSSSSSRVVGAILNLSMGQTKWSWGPVKNDVHVNYV